MLVSNTLLVDGVVPLPNAIVQCELIAPGPVFYGSTALVKDSQTSTASNGTWTLDLIPNLALNPAGTLYRIREYSRSRQAEPVVYVIYVPDTGGPYTVDQLVTEVENPYEFTGGTTPPTQRIDNIIVVTGSADLPLVGNADGDLAVDSATDTLWQWDGTSWKSVSMRVGDTLPTVGHTGETFHNTSDGNSYVFNGSDWVVMGGTGPPGPPGGGASLLAVGKSNDFVLVETASVSLVPVDSTYLVVSFTPPTDLVRVVLNAIGQVDADTALFWGIIRTAPTSYSTTTGLAIADQRGLGTPVKIRTFTEIYYAPCVSGVLNTFQFAHSRQGAGSGWTADGIIEIWTA